VKLEAPITSKGSAEEFFSTNEKSNFMVFKLWIWLPRAI